LVLGENQFTVCFQIVHISKLVHSITGLAGKFTNDDTPSHMYDTRLPLGARKSPSIFNQITLAVRRTMNRRGFPIVVYLNDLFLSGLDFDACLQAYNTLIYILRSLGFQGNWNKIVDPCFKLCFLGVMIDPAFGTL
jgi:hypothetical protein